MNKYRIVRHNPNTFLVQILRDAGWETLVNFDWEPHAFEYLDKLARDKRYPEGHILEERDI